MSQAVAKAGRAEKLEWETGAKQASPGPDALAGRCVENTQATAADASPKPDTCRSAAPLSLWDPGPPALCQTDGDGAPAQ